MSQPLSEQEQFNLDKKNKEINDAIADNTSYGQIAGAAMSAYQMSDIRLKKDIKLVGKSPKGIKIYNFKYKDDNKTYQGVMAHQVPQASIANEFGYLMVDYNKLDVEFKEI